MRVFSLNAPRSGVAHEEPREVAGPSQEHLCGAWKSPVSLLEEQAEAAGKGSGGMYSEELRGCA